jgi:hypothetical protein
VFTNPIHLTVKPATVEGADKLTRRRLYSHVARVSVSAYGDLSLNEEPELKKLAQKGILFG